MAEVNGERITQADLDRYEISGVEDLRESPGSISVQQELLQQFGLLRELIDQRVLLQRLGTQGVVVADGEIDAIVERRRLALGADADFSGHLKSKGVDLAAYREEIRRKLLVDKLLSRKIAAKVRVSDREIRDYYESHAGAFAVPEQQVHLAQILVADTEVSPIPNLRNDDATDRESARRKIQRIREELEEGADFEQLALFYSEDPVYTANGGDMGFIPQSALDKTDFRLRRALTDLKPGEFSSVVQTDGEFRIMQLIAIVPAGRRELDDPGVRESIRDVLMNRKQQLLRMALYEVERNQSKIRNQLAERVVGGDGIGN